MKENSPDRVESREQQPAVASLYQGDTTDLFLELTPEKVLDAVEAAGLRCNPICYALNSFENRVYDIQLEDGHHVVAKFYRPGRWTAEQILEEHQFLDDLEAAEVPVCGVKRFPDGRTLASIDGIFYCLYDRRGGRAPDEVDEDLLERLGMLTARIHTVGASRAAPHRISLTSQHYIRPHLKFFERESTVPDALWPAYRDEALTLATLAEGALADAPMQRVHGDFHLGNLLLREGVLHVLDFDDMVNGPAVQDAWMIVGRGGRERAAYQEGYERFGRFDPRQWAWAELLRGMRMVHYAAWLARRWHDPVFPITWPHFGTVDYWADELRALTEARKLAEAALRGDGMDVALAPDEEMTNADYFWDWED